MWFVSYSIHLEGSSYAAFASKEEAQARYDELVASREHGCDDIYHIVLVEGTVIQEFNS